MFLEICCFISNLYDLKVRGIITINFFFFFFLDKVCGGWIKLYFYDQSFKHMYLISNVSNGEPGLNIQFFLFCHTILINLSNGNVRASFFVTKRRVMLPIYEWASRSHYIITNMSKLVPHIRWNKIYSVISPSNKLFLRYTVSISQS